MNTDNIQCRVDLCVWLVISAVLVKNYVYCWPWNDVGLIKLFDMDIKEVLYRIGYVRTGANLSARELSLRIGMSAQYIAQVENGRIVLTLEKLLRILEVCHFPVERFFAKNIEDWDVDHEFLNLFEVLPNRSKHNVVELVKILNHN